VKTIICDGYCTACSDNNVGTLIVSSLPGESAAFVCANCDRATFEIEAESQKDRYIDGAKFDTKGVY
jgi:hypothetical protein